MSRIKMFGCIPRRPDVSKRFFHDHWRHPHGTMGRNISTMRAYVQSHQIHSEFLGDDQTRFEGCAEVWFDNIADAADFPNEPIYVRDVLPDEPLFVDLPKLRFAFAREEVLVSGPNMRHDHLGEGDAMWRAEIRPTTIKLLQFIEEDGATPWDADKDYDLGRRIGALRHVRCRPAAEVHPDGAFVVGIRELWWPTEWDMEQGIAADRAAWDELLKRPKRATAFVATAEKFM